MIYGFSENFLWNTNTNTTMRPPVAQIQGGGMCLLVAGAGRVVAVAGAGAGSAGAAIRNNLINKLRDMCWKNTYLVPQVHGLAIVI